MQDKSVTTKIPTQEELIAGDAFRCSMIDKADDKATIMWHGWVIMDAFLAGVEWQKGRDKQI